MTAGLQGIARLLAPATLVLLLGIPAAAQSPVRVDSVVEDEEVYLGESFFFQIRVVGGQRVEKPDLSAFSDFEVREIPESWIRHREGGPWERFKFDEGTSFLYRLVALRSGSVIVPGAPLRVDGRLYESPRARLRVTLPPPSTDFRLSMSLSRREVFVGEPFELEAVWYYRKDGRYYNVNVPLLRHPDFRSEQSSGAMSAYAAMVRSFGPAGNWSGTSGSAVLGGVSYSTFTFRDVITPREPGDFSFEPSTVQVWVPRDDQDSSGSRRGWNFDTTVVSAPGLSLRVLPLPAAGRPAGFSGIVSEQLRIEAAVTPDVMNVGDPVTLRISLSGPPSLAEAELPALGDFPELVDGFALGTDPPAVELRDGEKIFRQTVRVRREGVGQVPPIEISYFNTRTRSYQIAASRPFRITVRPTRIVTADDLVGEETAGQVRARSWDEGILHNYPSTAVLLHRESYSAGGLFGRPGVSAVFGASLLALIGAFVYARRREAASARLAAAAAPARRASPPLARLAESLRRAGEAQEPLADLQAPDGREDRGRFERVREGLAAWREYLQLRLELRPGRVSPGEVQAELERRGVEESLRGEVRELLVRQESLRFRGDMRVSTEEVGGLLRQTLEIAQRLEESLGQA